MKSWIERQADLASLARRQLFFIGGAPRSGTTWLQLTLDCHPQISCRGEGLFWKALAEPVDRLVAERRQAIEAKNKEVFGEVGGYSVPAADDAEILLGTGILLAFEQQCAGKPCLAVGEKTPENVFLFPRLKRLFPAAKFIGVARDPRDVLTSAWHFFGTRTAQGDETAAKIAYIRRALPAMREGTRAMLALIERHPDDCLIVTYERMRGGLAGAAAQLFRFLGVSDADAVVADCVERTRFAKLSRGRNEGVAQDGSFFRKGSIGDWPSTLNQEMNEIILAELGWSFPQFGWQP